MNELEFMAMENGKLKEYEVYKICHNKDNDKNYLIYIDDGNLYASVIIYENGKYILEEIKDESEWNFLDMEIKNNE